MIRSSLADIQLLLLVALIILLTVLLSKGN